jgi:hypothetical protein
MIPSGVGVQWNNGFVHFSTPFTETCGYNALYIDLSVEGGRAAFSTFLTARAAGVTISRVDYTQRADGTCWVDLVEI